MALLLDMQQTMLRDSARDFLQREAPVSQLRDLRDTRHPDGLSRPLWKEFGLMGFAGTLLPDAHGGLDLGVTEAAVVMEEIGRNLSASPFWSTSVVCASALRLGGSEAQQRTHLPMVGSGESVIALAIDEAPKHRPEAVTLSARTEGAELVLDGSKTFVVDGHIANAYIVVAHREAAASGPGGLVLVLVDRHAEGLEVERTWMVDAHNAARLRFNGVRVAADDVIGLDGQGPRILERTLDIGRTATAAELLGISDEVLTRTVTYLKERSQFGRLIGEFQALQHRIARVYAQVEVARAAVMKAAWALDANDERAAFHASVAKAKAGSVAALAVQEAVQMHGGMGITDELDIGLFMKRARVLDELLGDRRFHARRVATLNGY